MGGRFHRCDGFRFVVLDADQHLPRAEHVAHDERALEDGRGALAHQHVVAGNEGLAFGAVQDEGIQIPLFSRVELQVAGEHCAAQTDDAGIAQIVVDLHRCGTAEVKGPVRNPFVAPVRLDHHAHCRKPGGMRHQAHFDGNHGARSRGMHGGRHIAVGAADALALEYAFARLYQGARHAADALMQRNDEQSRRWRHGDGQPGRGFLVVGGLDAAVKLEQALQCRHAASRCAGLILNTGYFHFQFSTLSPIACMEMQSTGQGGRHSSQPVH